MRPREAFDRENERKQRIVTGTGDRERGSFVFHSRRAQPSAASEGPFHLTARGSHPLSLSLSPSLALPSLVAP